MQISAMFHRIINNIRLIKYTRYPAHKLDYLTHCSMDRKYIYFCTPKVASSKLKILLQIAEARSRGEPDPIGYLQKTESPLSGILEIEDSIANIFESDKYYRFTFVRNPYTRILSCYLEKIVKSIKRNRYLNKLGIPPDSDVSFLEFLEKLRNPRKLHLNPHWAPQFHFLRPDRIRYHFIGRLEHLDAHLPALVHRLYPDLDLDDILASDMRSHATGATDKVKKFYGSEEIALIQKLYRNDFLYFSYPLDIDLCHI